MHQHRATVQAKVARRLRVAAIGLAVAAFIGMFALRPDAYIPPSEAADVRPTYDAIVTAVERVDCPEGLTSEGMVAPLCMTATLRLLGGPDRGRSVTLDLPHAVTTPTFTLDERIVVAYQPDAEPSLRYSFVDRHRKPVLIWIALIFAAAVVGLGRLRGLAALAGLAVSVAILLMFVLPALLSGRPPLPVAIVSATAIAIVALYLAHGTGPMTTVALLGTVASLLLTALLSDIFVRLAQLSGFTSDEAILVQLTSGTVDVGGLVLAGIVIGALGALDDVTVTQASAVAELHHANPSLTPGELYRSAIRVGRDHIASTVNTLLLAYAGASLPLLLYFVVSDQSLGSVINQEVVATEVIRTLIGSIGLVASVPVTTWLAARITGSAPTPALAD